MTAASPASSPRVVKTAFGTPDGAAVDLFTVHNANGVEARIMTYGGVPFLRTPDRDGKLTTSCSAARWRTTSKPSFSGARSAATATGSQGALRARRQAYPLAANNGPNHLQRRQGWDKMV
jgi:aldose 1-epimerase